MTKVKQSKQTIVGSPWKRDASGFLLEKHLIYILKESQEMCTKLMDKFTSAYQNKNYNPTAKAMLINLILSNRWALSRRA